MYSITYCGTKVGIGLSPDPRASRFGSGFARLASCMVLFSCIPFRGVDFLIKVVRMRRCRNDGWGCSAPFVKPKLRLYSGVERC